MKIAIFEGEPCERAAFEVLAETRDIVSLQVPGSPQTENMIGADAFAA